MPPPKVQSGLIRLSRREELPKLDLMDYKGFLVGLYSMRRKALKNKVPETILLKAGIDPMCHKLVVDELIPLITLGYTVKDKDSTKVRRFHHHYFLILAFAMIKHVAYGIAMSYGCIWVSFHKEGVHHRFSPLSF